MSRVAALCEQLDLDAQVREALVEGGLSAAQWDELMDAVRAGAASDELLDTVEEAAQAAGLDGITTGTRQFEPLPGGTAGFRAVHGWRCPHPHPCGRGVARRGQDAPACALTGDPLSPVRVVSG
ncbi:hypothetical protein JOF41_003591 [Saccharothrix coeruleofusca]|uniref:hypothetical protein n=1 Tax=Saccharothrix coeruleofusca TaxID=33919 RepID=UPI001AEB578B|nr:hypothetical protein [Saccharothrix coeruleofusca]MBP2337413.1 hypothetical protein [Saccharothrix coeruleofusca]